MKSLLDFIVLFLGIVRPTSSAVLVPAPSLSLYNVNDKIVVLTSQNFSSVVYGSNTAWLIEFYGIWCGHCQSYANTYREIGIDAWAWKTVVRIGAINCFDEENRAICTEHKIQGYPTLRLIPPGTIVNNPSKVISLRAADDSKDVERELIKELGDMDTKMKYWPNFTPVNRITFEELYAHIPSTVKLLLVIAEKRADFTGRQIMLDFSKYREQLAIFRTTTDGKLWRKFHIDITDTPALFVILRNRTAERIFPEQNISENGGNRNLFNHAIRTYIHKTKSIDNFDDRDLEEIILSKNALKKVETKQKLAQNKNQTDEVVDKNTIYRKVNMIDLELALAHMFRQEVPQMQDIQGETYDALVHWLSILTKYFPGREPVMAYLKHLQSKVIEQSNGFSGNKFLEMANMKTSDAYLPDNHDQYQHCSGSAPQYRGYPCALWLLFHTLTVSQVQTESEEINVIEIPSAIKNYVKHFFTCRQCSEHFMKETNDLNQLDLKNKYNGILYLWKIHNHVNKRIHGEITEDPKHPKVQFPSKFLCRTCQSINNSKIDNEFDGSNTIDFLLKYYSKENIDSSTILKKSQLVNQQERKRSKIELYNEMTQKSGFLRFLTTILQRFSLYICIAFIIIILLIRRRYCKAKRKRYTI